MPLQLGGICLCNLVNSSFANCIAVETSIATATQWKLPLQRSLETGLKPESHGAVAPMAAANSSYMSDYV
jgi:hypothetical protein